MCVCLCDVHACTIHVRRLEDTLQSEFSLYTFTYVLGINLRQPDLCGKHLYPLSYLSWIFFIRTIDL